MAVHQNSVFAKKIYYAPFTRGTEQVYISNIWKISTLSLIQKVTFKTALRTIHTNLFFINDAHCDVR